MSIETSLLIRVRFSGVTCTEGLVLFPSSLSPSRQDSFETLLALQEGKRRLVVDTGYAGEIWLSLTRRLSAWLIRSARLGTFMTLFATLAPVSLFFLSMMSEARESEPFAKSPLKMESDTVEVVIMALANTFDPMEADIMSLENMSDPALELIMALENSVPMSRTCSVGVTRNLEDLLLVLKSAMVSATPAISLTDSLPSLLSLSPSADSMSTTWLLRVSTMMVSRRGTALLPSQAAFPEHAPSFQATRP